MPPKKKQAKQKTSQKALDVVKDSFAEKLGINTDADNTTQADTSLNTSQNPTPTSTLAGDKSMDFKDQVEVKSSAASSQLEEEKATSSTTNKSGAD